ncbi:MAG: hypothetical protein V9G12_07055 [Microthrixaceae bacterium]
MAPATTRPIPGRHAGTPRMPNSAGAHVRFVDVPGEGHTLLRRSAWWNRFATESVLEVLGRPAT